MGKCHFNVPEVKCLGLRITAYNIQADPARISAIQNLRKPRSVRNVRSLLGLVNNYGKSVHQVHMVKAPFEALLTKNAPFQWGQRHDAALRTIQQILSGPLLLALYDTRQALVIAADACDSGIGGVLLQRYPDGNEKAIFHVSKALTKAQENYSQIEKEALSLIMMVQRLKEFILQTDHRPLLALFNPSNMRGLCDRTAARRRRWALRLIGFDFTIEYVRITEFGHADAFSRLISAAKKKRSGLQHRGGDR